LLFGGRLTPPVVEVPSAPWLERVLETTDRKAVGLVAVVLVHVLVAVEVLVVGVIATILCRTPEVGVGTHDAEITIAAPVTGRENRETIGIFAIAVVVPTAGGLQLGSCGRGTSNSGPQSVPVRIAWQVPALGANALLNATRAARLAVCAGGIVHGHFPGVEATVLGTVCTFVFIAAAPCVIAHVRYIARVVVQILGHPGLSADGDGLVNLAVADVGKLAVVNIWIQVGPVRLGTARPFGWLRDLNTG